MNKLGSLGPVVFIVSEGATRTIDDFQRSAGGRWAQHDIIGQKSKKQWLGPGADTVTFSVLFDVRFGLHPRKEIDQLTELERAGKALPLVLGRKGIGVGLWVITSMTQAWNTLDGDGNVLSATVNLTLEEYVK
ncbi:phage tail protein [Cohnella nanjingensis]|uniref:Phage tail protein n=1 Tax=Cohnella nanjingensis TaxID=1387779 RepID=A0A7X0VE09_9BACL|nr:phage tail protein [Cohnella nanjingensis]MBB6670510.1 phage tail protein [Cohnella nanjingensis]